MPRIGGPPFDKGGIATVARGYRLRLMLAITLGYGIAYTCRLALNVVKKPLIDDGIFSPGDLGTIGSALFYSYAVGKLCNGFLADHASARRFLSFGILASALLTIGMGFSRALWLSALLWGVNGWFQSMGGPASVIAMTHWFADHERGRYYGIWSIGHSLGEGLTFAGVAAVASLLGWQWGFWSPGIVCIGVAAFVYLMLVDRPSDVGLPAVGPAPMPVERESFGTVFRTQLSILRMPAVWVLGLSSASVYVARYAVDSWGVLYLQEARHYSLAAAGSMLTVSTIAGMMGAVGFGYLSDTLFGARRPPANLLFSLIEIVGLWLTLFGPGGTATVLAGLFLFGFGMTGLLTSLGGLFAVDLCPKRVAGAAIGVIGVFSYLGAALQEQVSGALIQHGMTQLGSVRRYDFGPAAWFWIGSTLVTLLLPLTLWRARARD